MMEHTISGLDRADDQFADTHLLFMVRLADHFGFGPEGKAHEDEEFFDLLEGRFTSEMPGHEYYVTHTDLLNRYLITARQVSVGNISVDRTVRNRMLDTLLLYFQLHIDKMPEMVGHKVLREIL
jgi:DNA repair protein RecO (recombination protein O)